MRGKWLEEEIGFIVMVIYRAIKSRKEANASNSSVNVDHNGIFSDFFIHKSSLENE